MSITEDDYKEDREHPNIVTAMNLLVDFANKHKMSDYEYGAAVVHLMAGFIHRRCKTDNERGALLAALMKDTVVVMTKMDEDESYFFQATH